MSSLSHWRAHSRKVISGVIAENPNATPEELRRLVSKAYPFGERAMHPYKMWQIEVKALLGPIPKAAAIQREKVAELHRKIGQWSLPQRTQGEE